jgi:hypothetical protein
MIAVVFLKTSYTSYGSSEAFSLQLYNDLMLSSCNNKINLGSCIFGYDSALSDYSGSRCTNSIAVNKQGFVRGVSDKCYL